MNPSRNSPLWKNLTGDGEDKKKGPKFHRRMNSALYGIQLNTAAKTAANPLLTGLYFDSVAHFFVVFMGKGFNIFGSNYSLNFSPESHKLERVFCTARMIWSTDGSNRSLVKIRPCYVYIACTFSVYQNISCIDSYFTITYKKWQCNTFLNSGFICESYHACVFTFSSVELF